MPVQQTNATNAYESAVGSLLAALAQGAGTPGDAAAFQTQLATSLNAVTPHLQSGSGEQPVSSDEPRQMKVRQAGDDSNGASAAVANPSQLQTSVAAASSPNQDNSSSAPVSQENGSSTAQSGMTTAATTTA